MMSAIDSYVENQVAENIHGHLISIKNEILIGKGP